MGDRYLIVNADDFGLSTGINEGIVCAHEHGIVTSTSLMVRGSGARDAAEYARRHRNLSVGLHVDLGEWIYREGQWERRYEVVSLRDAKAIRAEFARQIEAFRDLVGANPTHLDSHQHVHLDEPVRSILIEAAETIDIPVRSCTRGLRFCGDFYGQSGKGYPYPGGISLNNITTILSQLSVGWTELGCHPGLRNDTGSVYEAERAAEVKTLTDPHLQGVLESERITLASFRDLSRDTGGSYAYETTQ